MRIMSAATVTLTTVLDNIASDEPQVADVFTDAIVPELWTAAVDHGVDPVGAIAQAAKETGWGRFGGAITAEWRNTCGLKNTRPLFPGVDDGDQPLAHARFPSWRVGALAHVQHLAAYAGRPVSGLIVDPRYWLVLNSGRPVPEFEGLSGRWAPSPTYGQGIVNIAARLRGTP